MSVLLFALSLAALPVHAQMIKCVDERGVTHYTDKPRPGCKGGEVDIRSQPPISGKVPGGKQDLGAEERDFQRRQNQRGREEEAEAKRLADDKRRCASLRANLERYSAQRRIASIDAKGERVFMDDAKREAKLSQLNEEIAQKCR